jgi:DNA or RNA helicases of superfamily II
MNFDRYRIGQLGAHQTILSLSLTKIVSIVLPTRYGKSDLIRCSFLDMYYQGLASCAAVLSPAVNLQRQMVKPEKIVEMFERYGIQMPDTLKSLRPTASGTAAFDQWKSLIHTNIAYNPTLISSTQQFGVLHGLGQTAWLTMWVKQVISVTGKPPVFFVDECHLGSYANQIGKLAQALFDAGAYVVVLTATPYRADGERIPGFDYELIDYEVIEHSILKHTGDPNIRLVQLRETLKGIYRMTADYPYSFADAWAERPSPLSDIDLIEIDADVTKFIPSTDATKFKRLKTLSGSESQRILGKFVVRNWDVQVECIKAAIRELKRLRATGGNIGVIVFVGNDTEDEDNHEAKSVLSIFKKYASELNVVIATSTTDSATDRIEAFVDGQGDVLIVKMMAGLGLDCPRLKIGVDLSPIRTVASYAQRLMRIATLYDSCKVAVWITPADPIGTELFHMIVTSSGGYLERTEASRVLDEKLTEIKPNEDDYFVENPEQGDVRNNAQHLGKREYWPQLEKFVATAQGITNHMSRATLMYAFESAFAAEAGAETQHEDLNEKIKGLRDSIQHWRNEWVKNILRVKRGKEYNGSKDKEFSAMHGQCWGQMLIDLGIRNGLDVNVETDIVLLERVKQYFQRKAESNHA